MLKWIDSGQIFFGRYLTSRIWQWIQCANLVLANVWWIKIWWWLSEPQHGLSMHNFFINENSAFYLIYIVLMHVNVFTVQSSVIICLCMWPIHFYCLAATPPRCLGIFPRVTRPWQWYIDEQPLRGLFAGSVHYSTWGGWAQLNGCVCASSGCQCRNVKFLGYF